MRTPEVMRITTVAVVGTIVFRKQADAENDRLRLRSPVDGIGIPHTQRGIKGTPRPPTPEEIRRRRSFADEHGVAGAIRDIRQARPGTLVDHAITFRPDGVCVRAPHKRHGSGNSQVIRQGLPGMKLARYQVLAPVGQGGMGEVYRARDGRLDRDVAIKVLPERLADSAEFLARHEREAKALAALSHPNLVAIFDVGTDQGISFAVMELLTGETLHEHLAQGALPLARVLEIGAAVADGLAAAHAHGL